jgi:hypothetical protein
MQRGGKHASVKIEELLGTSFCCWGRPKAIKRKGLQLQQRDLKKGQAYS